MQNNAVIACRKAGDIIKENNGDGKKKQKEKNPRCFEVSFSDGTCVMLTEEEVLEFGLYSAGDTVKPLSDILSSIIYERIRDGILNYVLYTLRTEKQVRDKAFSQRKENGSEEVWGLFYDNAVERLISYLKEQKYIDDSLYARSYIKARCDRNAAASMIQYELRERGISDSIISLYLDGDREADYERAYNALVKRMKGRSPQGVKMDEKERAGACRFLYGKGFSPDAALKAVERYEDSED